MAYDGIAEVPQAGLLEALTHLLMHRGARRMAARAYLQASYKVQDEKSRTAYRQLAKQVLSIQTVGGDDLRRGKLNNKLLTLKELEKTFQQELREAATWYATVQQDERNWINRGVDVDAAFFRKYFRRQPQVGKTP